MKEFTGYFLYDGKHTTQQVSDIKFFFEKFLVIENFDIIIELGTSFGGLTYILDDIVKENNLTHNIHTFDYSYKEYVAEFLNKRGCTYHVLDERDEIFKNTVINLLINSGKSLLLCDGGDKKQEFIFYSNYLKNGDIIMAHDYAFSDTVFENEIRNKYWNWFELSYKDIQDSVETNNLECYKTIDFKYSAWACFKKT